jgi:hypothetical protein
VSARLTFVPVLLCREDAAAYLGDISTRKLDELQAQGRLIPKKLDGRRVYLRADLDEFGESLPDWEVRTKPDP